MEIGIHEHNSIRMRSEETPSRVVQRPSRPVSLSSTDGSPPPPLPS